MVFNSAFKGLMFAGTSQGLRRPWRKFDHSLLVARLGMSGAKPLLYLYACIASTVILNTIKIDLPVPVAARSKA